jgi:uncharacterized membrane protein
MSEEPEAAQPETEETDDRPAAEQSAPEQPTLSDEELKEGKLFAILSYLSVLCLIPIFMRKNEFALYHARQGLLLAIAGFIVSVIGVPTAPFCVGLIILAAGYIFLLVLTIMGMVNAGKLQMKPLPLIGKLAETWFAGITVAK